MAARKEMLVNQPLAQQVAERINAFRELCCALPGNSQILLSGAEIVADRVLRSLRLCKLALGSLKESGRGRLSTDE
jgi:hypothetical protein